MIKEYFTNIVTVVFICFCMYLLLRSYDNIKGGMVTVNYKGSSFLVRDINTPGKTKEKAVEILYDITERLKKLVKYMLKTHPDHETTELLKYNLNMRDVSDPCEFNICENFKDSQFTSYSLNKGEKIALCIRNKDTDEFIDRNTVMFVAIHELAHVMTKTIGHESDFWENMSILLCEANSLNLYDYNNYKNNEEAYCGTKITNTPLKCDDGKKCAVCDDKIKKWKSE